MGTTLNVKLSTSSISKAIDEVNAYRESLKEKCRIFRNRLAEVGIDTAKSNCGEYTGMIVFEKRDDGENSTYIIATDGQKITRQWLYKGGIKSVEVSPLLMAEFGSGWLAKVMDYSLGISGVGQGTFPGQKHAFDPQGWWWTTPDGERHHSKGEEPTFPMYAATTAMLFEIERIAKEVFQTNRVVKC